MFDCDDSLIWGGPLCGPNICLLFGAASALSERFTSLISPPQPPLLHIHTHSKAVPLWQVFFHASAISYLFVPRLLSFRCFILVYLYLHFLVCFSVHQSSSAKGVLQKGNNLLSVLGKSWNKASYNIYTHEHKTYIRTNTHRGTRTEDVYSGTPLQTNYPASILLNSFMPSRFFYLSSLDESISIIRDVWLVFFYHHVLQIFLT